MDLTTILAVSIPAIFAGLGVYLDNRSKIRIKEMEIRAEDKEVERLDRAKHREETRASIEEQTRADILSKIEESIKKHAPRCELIHAQLESDLMKVANQKVAEGLQAHKQIVKNIASIREEIKVLLLDKNKEDGIRKKYESIRFAAIKVFYDKGCKNFAIYKADAFYKFIKDNMKTIYQSKHNFDNALATIGALYLTVKDQGYHLAGKDFTNCFYNSFHAKSTDIYLEQLKFISIDSLNNKEERFVDVSMNYMQQFLSEMVMAYQSWKEDQVTELKNSHEIIT